MSATASAMTAIVWVMSSVAWLFSKIMWLALLLVGLFFALLMTAAGLMDGKGTFDHWDIGLFFAALIPISIPGLVNTTAIKHRRTVDQAQIPITIKRSWFATAGRVIGLLMMALACANALASGTMDHFERGVAIAAVAIFSALVLSLIRLQLIVSLTLSPEGLDYSLFRIGPIGWRDITSVDVEGVLRTDVVALHLRDEETHYQRGFKRAAPWTRFFASTPFSLPDAMFDVPAEWLKRAIQIRLDYFGVADRPSIVQRQGTPA